MKVPHRKMRAHPITYLIGNLFTCFIIWIGPAILLSLVALGGWLRVVLLLSTLICAYILEYQYLTPVVARIVERLFPNEQETKRYELSKAAMEEARHRGHW
jgi:hypothetical protein